MKLDVVIIGCGAAGMMCAIQAGQRGRAVALLDHSARIAEKIRISGGGRCNFTNLNTKPENFISENPDFCRSALARYKPQDFISLLRSHGIPYHEKKLGQLFCDHRSDAIIEMLVGACEAAGVKLFMKCDVAEASYTPLPEQGIGAGHHYPFHLSTSRGEFNSASLVIATGGLSIPKIGATPFGYQIAEQFGIPITKLRPGLVPLIAEPGEWVPYARLSGISLDALVSCGKQSFRENVLLTHRGLSGPAILQISSYWEPGNVVHINLLPDRQAQVLLAEQKSNKRLLSNYLAQWLPKSFSEVWCAELLGQRNIGNRPLVQYSNGEREQIANLLHDWQVRPAGTAGYGKAEVTCGGVNTRALSSKTMECLEVPGLYFIGEVLDVTGQLGGYNLQWAWSSGYAAGQDV